MTPPGTASEPTAEGGPALRTGTASGAVAAVPAAAGTRTEASPEGGPGTAAGTGPGAGPHPRRWWALAAVAVGQLMIAADATVLHIALPTIQPDLGLGDGIRHWPITAFALAYAGLLLLGGRLPRLLGLRTCLLIGLGGFAAASLPAGLAGNPETLIAARGLQGAFGALYTPSALALLGTTFTAPADRARAFGVYGTIMGASTAVGLVLGGALTEWAGWRWSLLVAVPIACTALIGVLVTVHADPPGERGRLDVPGALLGTAGLIALVHGFGRTGTVGWGDPLTPLLLALGVGLLVAFVRVQRRSPHPLLPLRLFANRARVVSYLSVFAMAMGTFAGFFLLTFALQDARGLDPLRTGLAFLPYPLAMIVGVRCLRRPLERVAPHRLLVPGLLLTGFGLALLPVLGPDSPYPTHILPIFALLGLGGAAVLVTANSTATRDAGPDTAVAGALVMVSMQVGSAFGVAGLGAVAAATAGGDSVTDVLRGHGIAGLVAAGLLAGTAALVLFLSRARADSRFT
ncbi:MFS transporter [Streptomyces calidiresistens]|uniref:MFS transporter n=1 Tax=Streptomyces calidiresistens TaxID=1485586 RepID=A0A7W3T116_9ACTN|nr:MFS transporter [Streptomyces calidiresistens]